MVKVFGLFLLTHTTLLWAEDLRFGYDQEVLSHHNTKDSRLAISLWLEEIADTRYEQAMSAYHSTLDLDVVAMRLDEGPFFQMRGNAITSAKVAQQQLLENTQSTDPVEATQAGVSGGGLC